MSLPHIPAHFGRRVALSFFVVVLAVATPHGGTQPPVPPATALADPFPNFDIRDYKTDPRLADVAGLAAYMDAVKAPAPATAGDTYAAAQVGLASLRNALPGVQVQEGALGGVEVVSAMPGTPFLTGPGDDRVATLRAFLNGNQAAYGLAGGQVDELVVVADQMNPAGNMAWVELEQRINGIPVFQGQLRGAFTPKGELTRTNGRLATGVGAGLPSSPALSAAQAVAIAAATVGLPATEATLRERERTRRPDRLRAGSDGRRAPGVARVLPPGARSGAPGVGDGSVRRPARLPHGRGRGNRHGALPPEPHLLPDAAGHLQRLHERQPGAGVALAGPAWRRLRRAGREPAERHADRQRAAVLVQQPRLDHRWRQRRERPHRRQQRRSRHRPRRPQRRRCRGAGHESQLQFLLQPRPRKSAAGRRAPDARLPKRRSDQPVLLGQPFPRRDLPVRIHRAVPQLPARQLRPRRRRRRPDQRRGPGLVRQQQRELLDRRRRHARPPAGVPLDRTHPRLRRRPRRRHRAPRADARPVPSAAQRQRRAQHQHVERSRRGLVRLRGPIAARGCVRRRQRCLHDRRLVHRGVHGRFRELLLRNPAIPLRGEDRRGRQRPAAQPDDVRRHRHHEGGSHRRRVSTEHDSSVRRSATRCTRSGRSGPPCCGRFAPVSSRGSASPKATAASCSSSSTG